MIEKCDKERVSAFCESHDSPYFTVNLSTGWLLGLPESLQIRNALVILEVAPFLLFLQK